jgi:hypothetical protein
MRRSGLVLALLLSPGAALAAPAQDCPVAPAGEPARQYRNSRLGFGFDYPPIFSLDPDSIAEAGDGARFWTANRRATVAVNAAPNTEQLPLGRLLADAEGDVLHNSAGVITYRRRRETWFVISGYMVGRIFYRRSLITRGGIVATLWMEFPPEWRPCLDAAVTLMSLSFREITGR